MTRIERRFTIGPRCRSEIVERSGVDARFIDGIEGIMKLDSRRIGYEPQERTDEEDALLSGKSEAKQDRRYLTHSRFGELADAERGWQ